MVVCLHGHPLEET